MCISCRNIDVRHFPHCFPPLSLSCLFSDFLSLSLPLHFNAICRLRRKENGCTLSVIVQSFFFCIIRFFLDIFKELEEKKNTENFTRTIFNIHIVYAMCRMFLFSVYVRLKFIKRSRALVMQFI